MHASKETLDVYCHGSGPKINMEKSSVFFGLHCDAQVKGNVVKRLGVINVVL
jgi:hypothetical protein